MTCIGAVYLCRMWQSLTPFRKKLALACAGGILLWAAWPPHPGGFSFLLFLGLVPFFWIEELITREKAGNSRLQVFAWTYLGFLIWNGATTWWISLASPGGGIFAVLANSAFMALVFLLYHIARQQLNRNFAYLSFFAYWLGFEYLHLHWELAWPWLTLGNGFAEWPQAVQWYSLTGVLGGSLWILAVNMLLFRAIRLQGIFMHKQRELPEDKDLALARKARLALSIFKLLFLIVVPLSLSAWSWKHYEEKGDEVEIVIVQPGIDPYTEKFPGGSHFIKYRDQIERFIRLSEEKITPSTRFVLWPETALPGGINVERFFQSNQYRQIRQFLERHPQMALVCGIEGYRIYEDSLKPTATARWSNGKFWYDAFNSAIMVGAETPYQFYHKSKLVPGVERMPYPGLFGWLDYFAIDLGGISGSLGMQDEPSLFRTKDSLTIAPVICFESVFGDYMAKFVRQGAQAVFIMTNDGWWGNTAGYKQHLAYASLRAVENRKSIARSANTGISAFINQKGIRIQQSKWWTATALRGNIRFNEEKTPYALNGDVIGRVAAFMAVFFLLFTLSSILTNRFYFRVNKIR